MARPITYASRLALSAACFVLPSCAGGTDDPASTPAALSLSNSNSNSTVTASANQEIDLKLQTIGPGDYTDPSISSASVRFLSVSEPPAQNPGGPTQLFRFEAVTAGSAAITIPHSVDSAPFTVTIVVQ
jgi:hypothetical protein